MDSNSRTRAEKSNAENRTQSGVELVDRTRGYPTLTPHGAGWGLEPVEPAERRRVEIACTRLVCAKVFRAQALPSRPLVVSLSLSSVSLNRLAPSDAGAYESVCRERESPRGLRSHLRLQRRKGSAPFGNVRSSRRRGYPPQRARRAPRLVRNKKILACHASRRGA